MEEYIEFEEHLLGTLKKILKLLKQKTSKKRNSKTEVTYFHVVV